jgi:hypothetical protein
MPTLIIEIPAEEASHLFCSRVLPVKEPPGSEVVGISSHRELLVGGKGPLRIVL